MGRRRGRNRSETRSQSKPEFRASTYGHYTPDAPTVVDAEMFINMEHGQDAYMLCDVSKRAPNSDAKNDWSTAVDTFSSMTVDLLQKSAERMPSANGRPITSVLASRSIATPKVPRSVTQSVNDHPATSTLPRGVLATPKAFKNVDPASGNAKKESTEPSERFLCSNSSRPASIGIASSVETISSDSVSRFSRNGDETFVEVPSAKPLKMRRYYPPFLKTIPRVNLRNKPPMVDIGRDDVEGRVRRICECELHFGLRIKAPTRAMLLLFQGSRRSLGWD
ncbi:hypothetical protein Q1695_013559 [Nippostrongylus brasiliensis]|nr:hypothetical protein Q1695_013559 [Nippostrongylus brasiliensis]